MQSTSLLTSSKFIRRSSYSTAICYKTNRVPIGGGAPIVIQSMTNTNTCDIVATIEQILELVSFGSELVRITVNNKSAACAVPKIREGLDKKGVFVPLIGDFHFNGHMLLNDYPDCAQALSKYRINPGNVGKGDKHDRQFSRIIEIACKYAKPIRIGVNWGSLDQDLLAQALDGNAKQKVPLSMSDIICATIIQSALNSARAAEIIGLEKNKIILSCKTSVVHDLITIYKSLANQCDYALHLGLTEAGIGSKGIVASSAALAILLQEGIGDTIRISLTPELGDSRSKEIIVAQEILQAMGIRNFVPTVTSCPGCGRTSSIAFQQLATKVQTFLRTKMSNWKMRFPGVESMNVAVMGCTVNGPGESKHANIGISLPGIGEPSTAIVFVNGKKHTTIYGDDIAEKFQEMIIDYVNNNYN